jgi:8-oxo-dGTP pyrophosphatase MutT (NUDIX family)
MLLTHFDPEVGLPPRWITPGGGIDEGETARQAAIRELFEETGIQITDEQLGDQIWHTSGRWDWSDGNFHTYEDTFFVLETKDFTLDDSRWTQDEFRDILETRWWSVADLLATGDSVAPHGLAEFLGDHFSSSL